MLRSIIAGLTVLVMLSAGTVMGQVADKEKIAVAAAEKWLIMIDGEKYAESWREAAEFFRTAVKQEQ